MSLLRIFPGSNDKESRLKSLLSYIVISADKKRWKDISFDHTPNMVKGYGIPENATLDEMFSAFILPHAAYGYPGKRLCYHCLIDFNGLLGVSDAGFIAWQINQFLLPYEVQFIQGVHATKGDGRVLSPHVHTLINSITTSGPNMGRKFHLGKPVLYAYKTYMNSILRTCGLPVIELYEEGK